MIEMSDFDIYYFLYFDSGFCEDQWCDNYGEKKIYL